MAVIPVVHRFSRWLRRVCSRHQRLVGQLLLAQGVQHPADAPIHLLDPITEATVLRLALERLAGVEGDVRRGVRKVEEKRDDRGWPR